ncbi:MAG: rubrerythrin family protein [Halobacteriaceae archaeon]
MTPEEFLEAVRDEGETALSRLGSSKSLYADTAGDLEPPAVLRSVATAHHHAAAAFEGWAEAVGGAGNGTDASADGPTDLAAAWSAAADREREVASAVAGELDGGAEGFEPGPAPEAVDVLAGLDATPARAGGAVAWALARGKKAEQATGFFVGQADPTTASALRDVGDALEQQRDEALAVLGSVCTDEEDWAAAREAAADVLEAAYGEYVAALEEMGVNPKPVC